jgi:predicted acyltransferase
MDPEGIISTLPAIVTGLLGIELAAHFSGMTDKREKTIFLLLSGFLLAAAGLAWSPVFPMIKKLWTSSYVLYTAGLASMTLGAMYWLVDMKKQVKKVQLLVAFGINPLALYVGSELIIMIIWLLHVFGTENYTMNEWVFHSFCNTGVSPNLASLAWAVIYLTLWSVVAIILYKRKLIIKL